MANIFFNLKENLENLIFECLENEKIKVKVLNHGDMWVNNIMFKYDESGKVIDTIFVRNMHQIMIMNIRKNYKIYLIIGWLSVIML